MEEQPKYQAGMKVKHQSGFTGIIIGEPKYFGETYMYAVRNEFREYEFPEGELTIADIPEPKFKEGDNVIYTITSEKLRMIETVDYDEYDTIDGVNQFCWYYLASNADNMKLIVAEAFLEPVTDNQDEEKDALDRSVEIGYLNHRDEKMNQTEQPKAKISVTFNNRDGIKTVSPHYSPGDTVSFSQHQTDENGEIHHFMVYTGEIQFVNVFDFLAEEFTYCIRVQGDNLAEFPEVFESAIKGRLGGTTL